MREVERKSEGKGENEREQERERESVCVLCVHSGLLCESDFSSVRESESESQLT